MKYIKLRTGEFFKTSDYKFNNHGISFIIKDDASGTIEYDKRIYFVPFENLAYTQE